MKRQNAILIVLLLTAAVSTTVQAQVKKQTLTSAGQPRTYYSFMPHGTDKVPLVLLLHGSGRDGTTLIRPWESLAEKERIALVAADSLNKQGWNIAHDGPAFFKELVEVALTSGRVDPRRMYLFGHSAGGHHSIDIGLLESEYFAAVAVHAGALTHDRELMTANAVRKIPIAMWNGVEDRIVNVGLVREVKDYLVAQGFPVILTEMKGHTHDYYSRAAEVNKMAWAFLKDHALKADPKYKEYLITK